MKTLTGFKFIQFFIQDLSVEVCREWRKVGKQEMNKKLCVFAF